MKISFSPLTSDIIITVYVVLTLLVRFWLESIYPLSTGFSIMIGLSFLVFIWVFIQAKILNPNWFGLFNKK